MSWGCSVWEMLLQRIIYWRDGDRQCTWGSLKKEKITFLSLNKTVLSNIYGTERKQGLRRTFIDIMIGKGCHRIWVGESTPVLKRKKIRHCVWRKCLSLNCPEVFLKEQQAVFWMCICECVCVSVKAGTHIGYQETAIQEFNTKFPLLEERHLVMHNTCRQMLMDY